MVRTYKELIRIPTFEERFKYLQLAGRVGRKTFGHERYLNQAFYRSDEWKQIRNEVIARDEGCDLGIPGLEIHDRIYIHHMNPIALEDFLEGTSSVLDPNNLICCTYNTHLAIHYGDERMLTSKPIERRKHDTCPWKQ